MKHIMIGVLFFLQSTLLAEDFKTITFDASDGVTITADLYMAHADKSTPFIVLFHQAASSRGEYREIAPKLNKLGFNAIAIDQRSGDGMNGVDNDTVMDALEKDKEIGYLDAFVDLTSTIEYVKEQYAKGKVIGWGSSYSAALMLKLSGEFPRLVDGVVAFSPGEYFKPRVVVADFAKKIKVPIFVTSTRSEQKKTQPLFDVIPSQKTYFLPKTEGDHGSKALWVKFKEHQSYWGGVEKFLGGFKE